MDDEITEVLLSEETKISRSVLREFREKNLLDADWRIGQRNMVVWKRSAIDKLCMAWPEMDCLRQQKIMAAEKLDDELVKMPTQGPQVINAEVVRKFRNPQLLGARTSTEEILVRVHNNKNFAPGMCIRAKPPKGMTKIWTLDGRCPRWPGRW